MLATDEWGKIYSLLAHPGQQLIHVVAVPLGPWLQEARASADLHDIAGAAARRSAKLPRPKTESQTLQVSS